MSNQRIFSEWTTDEVLNCRIVTNWLLHPSQNSYRPMDALGYDQEHLQYDRAKWRQEWENMSLTELVSTQVGVVQVNGHRWKGISPQMEHHVPAVYKKVLAQRVREEGTIFSYVLNTGMSIFEWADISASVPIQSLELDLGTDKIVVEEIGTNLLRFEPFQGGYPLFVAVYSELKLTVHLSEPGTVEVKAYYTDIPTKEIEKLYGQHLYLWSNIDRSRLFQIQNGGFGTAIFSDKENLF